MRSDDFYFRTSGPVFTLITVLLLLWGVASIPLILCGVL